MPMAGAAHFYVMQPNIYSGTHTSVYCAAPYKSTYYAIT